MALPSNPSEGPIRISAIRQTFGGEPPDAISEYYRGGEYVDANDIGNIPSSGKIKWSDFYGARPAAAGGKKVFTTPGLYDWVIPDYDNFISFTARGGGGASGESSWDGPAAGNDPGRDGMAGVGSYVCGPDGSIVPSQPQSVAQPNRGAPTTYIGEPVVGAAWLHGRAGQGGGGFPRLRNGTPGDAGVRNPGPNDVIQTGGGGAGGICPPFVGNSSEIGSPGGAGGTGKKHFLKTDPGAPRPGEVWRVFVGSGGPVYWAINGKGGDGSVESEWG